MKNNIYTITKHIIATDNKNPNSHNNNIPAKDLETNVVYYISLDLFDHFISADNYKEVIQINKTSKYTPQGGIEEIGLNDLFKDIDNKVFTVFFTKASKTKTKKQIEEEKEAQYVALKEKINQAIQNSSISKVADEVIKACESNLKPIEETLQGEPRKLRGIKLTKYSSDGMYDVVDFDVVDTGKTNYNHRKINLQNIMGLITDNKLYLRKDLNLTESSLLNLF